VNKEYYGFGWDVVSNPVLYNAELKGKLTEEQSYMINKIMNNDKGVIHMGTGRGKSWVIYDTIVEKRCSTLVLCHNIQTADDMYAGIIKNAGVNPDFVGLVHSKSKYPRTGVIDVMTHASFVKNYKELINTYEMICYDECDYNLSFPVMQDYDCMVGALITLSPRFLYGFTWTPYRAEGWVEVLNRIFGEVWTYCDEYNYTPNITQVWYRYDWDYDFETFAELVNNLIGNENRRNMQLELYNKCKRKWNLILTKSVEECKLLHEKIEWSIILNGTLSKKELDYNMDLVDNSIKNGSGFTIVWTIDKMGRGVDIPPIDTVFLYSPIHFRGTVVQAVGRALRKFPSKVDVMIYDWCDMPILKKQQQGRLKDYSAEYKIDKKDFNFIKL